MGRDIHEMRRMNDKEDANLAAKNRQQKASTADWQNRTRGRARIGAWYAKRFRERVYERTYLNGT